MTDASDHDPATDRTAHSSGSRNDRVIDVIPVKRFVAVLWSQETAFRQACEGLSASFGAIDAIGKSYPFDVTDYYVAEMGPKLRRSIVSFNELFAPNALVEAKLECNDLESRFASNGKRSVNLDVGYLDHNKIVLASVKCAGQKIYLGRGIYADLVARFRSGHYEPFEWTFPDFRDGRYDSELAALRARYLLQLREMRRAGE